VIEHIPSKYKALSSNPSTEKKFLIYSLLLKSATSVLRLYIYGTDSEILKRNIIV
jgi:hypothetical protein